MIGIIGAMQVEIEKIDELLANKESEMISGISFTRGTAFGQEVVTAVCGMGKVYAALCAQTMILKYQPEAIINVGVAGGLTKKLGIADIAIAKEVVQHDMDVSLLGFLRGQLQGFDGVQIPCDKAFVQQIQAAVEELKLPYLLGTIASGDQFIADEDKKEDIKKTFGAIACEMEGASIGQICSVNHIPFAVIRAISDEAGGDAQMSFEEFTQKAAENSTKVVEHLLKNRERVTQCE